MSDPLGRLTNHAKALNEASDELRAKLECVEARLQALHVGVEVEYKGWWFGRILDKKWGLFFENGAGERFTLLQLPRSERVRFSLLLPEFLDHFCAIAASEATKVECANRVLDVQIGRLPEPGNS